MATKWTIDPAHSEITFKVRHMMISNVKGQFRNFTAEIESEDDTFKNANVSAEINADSVFTNNADRDEHLKGPDFLNVEANPKIKFNSKSINGQVSGELTINGVTKPIELDVEFGGETVDPWGNTKAGFSFEGKLKRSDFGLNWSSTLETGGLVVSDDVKIAGELQFTKQA